MKICTLAQDLCCNLLQKDALCQNVELKFYLECMPNRSYCIIIKMRQQSGISETSPLPITGHLATSEQKGDVPTLADQIPQYLMSLIVDKISTIETSGNMLGIPLSDSSLMQENVTDEGDFPGHMHLHSIPLIPLSVE